MASLIAHSHIYPQRQGSLPEPQFFRISLEADAVLAQWGPALARSWLSPRPLSEPRGQPEGPVLSALPPPLPPDELEDEKSPEGQEKHPSP